MQLENEKVTVRPAIRLAIDDHVLYTEFQIQSQPEPENPGDPAPPAVITPDPKWGDFQEFTLGGGLGLFFNSTAAFTMGITVDADVGVRLYRDGSDMTLGINHLTPAIQFSGDLGPVLLGAKFLLDTSFGITESSFKISPQLAVGTSFKVIPDHLAIHAGAGIDMYTIENKTIAMPTTKIGAGFTFNFTENIAADMILVASGLDSVESNKITFLLSVKN
jgi:hypothetical protein